LQPRSVCHVVAILFLALPTHAVAQNAAPAARDVMRVTRPADDGGEGSLRWAIERNNAAPGRFRIEIAPAGQALYVIKPVSPLPPIKGPVEIEGTVWKQTGESRFTVELFANRQKSGAEGEIFLGEVVTTSDASGRAKFSLIMDADVPGGVGATLTATVTSSEGATSEFSQPVALPN
jgi:hypothetical protein